MSKKSLVNDNLLSESIRRFGISDISRINLNIEPAFFRQDILGYWKWFVLNKKSSSLTSYSLKQTVLNHLISFCMYMHRYGYRVFVKNSTINVISISVAVANSIAAHQASVLTNILVKIGLPRRMTFVKHVRLDVNTGAVNPELSVASYFRITGVLFYKIKRNQSYASLINDVKNSYLTFAAKAYLLDRVNSVLCSQLVDPRVNSWFSIYDENGISVDICPASGYFIGFRYSVALDCCLFSLFDVPSYSRRKISAIWSSNFHPL